VKVIEAESSSDDMMVTMVRACVRVCACVCLFVVGSRQLSEELKAGPRLLELLRARSGADAPAADSAAAAAVDTSAEAAALEHATEAAQRARDDTRAAREARTKAREKVDELEPLEKLKGAFGEQAEWCVDTNPSRAPPTRWNLNRSSRRSYDG
jgi:hypothetical protein